MKNSRKTVIKIVSLFVITMFILTLIGYFMKGTNVNAPTDEENDVKPTNDSPYSVALSDFNENGMKAMWISYIDYQSVDFSTEEAFTNDITEMFNNCKSMGLNTVIVHARSFSDAFYKSDIFPSSHIMTGTQGAEIGFDSLAVMVEKAHEIGLRIEAWINPYRVKMNSRPKEISANNPANDTSLTVTTENGVYYNPALQKVRDLVTSGVVEIVKNYDVDGIHFDDYFYPDTDESIDADEYKLYSGNLSLEDWRRENVNMLVRQVYSAVKETDANVTFGISPQGNNGNNYDMQYSDIELWLKEDGYVDYICPQLYWGFGYTTKSGSDRFSFEKLSSQWADYERSDKVKLYIGLGAYRIGAGDGGNNDQSEWQSGENLSKMIQTINQNKKIDGYIIYTYNNLFGNTKYEDLRTKEVSAIANIK